MKTLLITLLTFLLINNAYACMAMGDVYDSYCHPDCATGYPNSTGYLERRAVCSVSEDAIAAQIQLAQRYKNGFTAPTARRTWAFIPTESEQTISKDQSVSDYWTKFSSFTKIILLANNGNIDAQLKLGHYFYPNDTHARNMINQFRDRDSLYSKLLDPSTRHEWVTSSNPNTFTNVYTDVNDADFLEITSNLKLIPHEWKTAYFWFKKSAEQGNIEAKEKVIELKQKINKLKECTLDKKLTGCANTIPPVDGYQKVYYWPINLPEATFRTLEGQKELQKEFEKLITDF